MQEYNRMAELENEIRELKAFVGELNEENFKLRQQLKASISK